MARRSFLVGTGAAVAIPWLEIMDPPTARADQGRPCRYLVSVGGISQLGFGNASAGPLTQLPTLYQPLDPIRAKVSLVTNLDIPTGPRGSLPPGGTKSSPVHYSAWAAMVTGTRGTGTGDAKGPSSDLLVSDAIGQGTRFPVLHYCAQPHRYEGGVLTCAANRSGRPINPITSPRLAYDELFSGGVVAPPSSGSTTPPTTPPPSAGLNEGHSVLDVVNHRSQQLRGILGMADRIRLDEHFEEIRSLEERLRAIPGNPGGGGGTGTGGSTGGPVAGCGVPPDPGADPAVDTRNIYSNEDLRNDVFSDMVAMAFACDLTRVATLMTTAFSCRMGTRELFGPNSDVHSMTHSPGQNTARAEGFDPGTVRREMVQWMVAKFAYLMIKLDQIPEGNGTVLDNTVGVQLWEYGNGPHSPNGYVLPIVSGSSHLRKELVVDGRGRHPSNYLQTAMHCVGVQQDFGEVPGVIDELIA